MVFKLDKIAIKLILKLKLAIDRCSIQICTVPGYGLKLFAAGLFRNASFQMFEYKRKKFIKYLFCI